jgi:hypothetical protein
MKNKNDFSPFQLNEKSTNFDVLVYGICLAFTAPDEERSKDAIKLVERNDCTEEEVERAKLLSVSLVSLFDEVA